MCPKLQDLRNGTHALQCTFVFTRFFGGKALDVGYVVPEGPSRVKFMHKSSRIKTGALKSDSGSDVCALAACQPSPAKNRDNFEKLKNMYS
jgi:hypothetical protein